jgi:thymidylate synthase (FAD)
MDFLEISEVVYEDVNSDPSKPLTIMNIERYGEFIIDGGISYLLTNYRALLYDYENHKEIFDKYDMDITKYYNSVSDADIIKRHYHVFNIKMDMATSKQFVRHRRQNLQELSRRYVSGDKAPFEFYISEKIKKSKAYNDVLTHIADSVELYNKLRDSGISPQEARRVIPQSAYTTIWSGWLPSGLKNFLDLRKDTHSQWEIRQIALEMEKAMSS